VGIEDPEERKRRIIAAAERQSQAAPSPPRPFIGVPPRIASFTGRVDELERLDAILMQEKPAAVTQASVGRAAVQGLGGVGKTSLAIEYAHRFRGLYAGVCWCPAETRTGLLSALASLAVTLAAATAEEADVEKAAKGALRRLAEQRATWLLVYDNVPAPDNIADLLPSAGARVLITSRFSDWSELGRVPINCACPGSRWLPANDMCVAPRVQAIFCRRRHQARRPPLAKIRPGRPAPAMGPGPGALRDHVPGASKTRAVCAAQTAQIC
jgi:hypothetical protein